MLLTATQLDKKLWFIDGKQEKNDLQRRKISYEKEKEAQEKKWRIQQ